MIEAKQQASVKAMDTPGKGCGFQPTVTHLIDGRIGIIERMGHVQVKRIGKQDATTTTLPGRRQD